MQVLIWKCYGDTRIYCVETVKQLKDVYEAFRISVSDWNINLAEIDAEFKAAAKVSHVRNMRALIIRALNKVDGKTHEMFEEFMFTNVNYEML